MLPLSPLLQRQESDLNTSTAPNAVFAAKPAPSGKKKNYLKPSVRKRIGAKKKGQFNKYYDKKKAAAAAAAAAAAQTPISASGDGNSKKRRAVTPAVPKEDTKRKNCDDSIPKMRPKDIRRMIYDHYILLQAPSPDEFATRNGEAGTVTIIYNKLINEHYTPNRKQIMSVISNAYSAIIAGNTYDPESRTACAPKGIKIPDGSEYQNIVADLIEEGLSIRQTHEKLNDHIIRNGGGPNDKIGRSSVVSCIKRMTKITYKAGKRPQGTSDPDKPWSQARRRWAAQMLLRMGEIEEDDTRLDEWKTENGDGEKVLPKCFQKAHLSKIDKSRTTYWDECHRKAVLGRLNQGKVTQFPRDENGKYDPEGTYLEEQVTMVVKFAKEGRMSFGVGEKDGEGIRCAPFDYSEKNIQTIPNYEKEVQDRVQQVKKLSDAAAKTGGWIQSTRDPNKFYRDNPTTVLDKVGKKTADKLQLAGINTIGDLANLTEEELPGIADHLNSIGNNVTLPSLKKYFAECKQKYSDEDMPPDFNHHKEPNPFLSRYGDAKDEWGQPAWRSEVKKCITDKICITDLVKFMVTESQKLYEDDNWHFYHDALSQLTHKVSINWMKQTKVPGELKTVFDHWIHSEHDLNKGFGGGRFDLRPPGNSPELMPLDNSLNQDIHVAVNRHVVLSNLSKVENDERTFSLRTPKQIASAYARVFDPKNGIAPTSKRILQDIEKTLNAMQVILTNRGVYVPGLAGGSVPGHRNQSVGDTDKRGGYKPYQPFTEAELSLKDDTLHQDLKYLFDECAADRGETERAWREIVEEAAGDEEHDYWLLSATEFAEEEAANEFEAVPI